MNNIDANSLCETIKTLSYYSPGGEFTEKMSPKNVKEIEFYANQVTRFKIIMAEGLRPVIAELVNLARYPDSEGAMRILARARDILGEIEEKGFDQKMHATINGSYDIPTYFAFNRLMNKWEEDYRTLARETLKNLPVAS